MDKKIISKASALALNTIFGYEPKFSHNLIDALGSAEAVFDLPEDEKRRIFGPYNKYPEQLNERTLASAADEYERLVRKGVQVVTIFEEEYPSLLRDCPDAPMALYVLSSAPASQLFNSRPALAMVGTRDLSLYGKEWCRRIVETISQAPDKPTIVSGLAIGVDINAHLAALDFGLPTIGVLPVGIDGIYPRRHLHIAERMIEAPGSAVITDYPPGTPPLAVNFLRRNRIIAGISGATVLVESKTRGGGMMTARLAFDYGRDVFALPGRIDDVRSGGCNLLVREKTAEIISSIESLPDQLGLGTYNLRRRTGIAEAIESRFGDRLPPEEKLRMASLANAVREARGICFDELCRKLGMEYSEVSRIAGLLENEGIICIDLMQRCTINTFFK
ncbi:MAG: DNA-processing protein DprA [Bacteroidales bacterium]|nr:DNA-processing protein DprA [Bacteroidales bacterium]